MATGTIIDTSVKYCTNTGDANTFADGITIVATSASNTAIADERCVIMTFTLLTNPIRKVQFEEGLNGMYRRAYSATGWSAWVAL